MSYTLPAIYLSPGRQGNQDDNARERGRVILFKEKAQGVSIAGRGGEVVALRRFCCRAGAMAEPELTPSHQGCSKDPPKAETPSSFSPSLILHGSSTMDTVLPTPRMLDCP